MARPSRPLGRMPRTAPSLTRSGWGAKVGLCLPRRIVATRVARRPSTLPSASTRYHFRAISTFGCVVAMLPFLEKVATTYIKGNYLNCQAKALLRGLSGPGAERPDQTGGAGRGPGRAHPAALRREEMGEKRPLGLGDHLAELVVHPFRVVRLGEPEPLGHAEDVGVHRDGRLAGGVAQAHVGRLPADPG